MEGQISITFWMKSCTYKKVNWITQFEIEYEDVNSLKTSCLRITLIGEC